MFAQGAKVDDDLELVASVQMRTGCSASQNKSCSRRYLIAFSQGRLSRTLIICGTNLDGSKRQFQDGKHLDSVTCEQRRGIGDTKQTRIDWIASNA